MTLQTMKLPVLDVKRETPDAVTIQFDTTSVGQIDYKSGQFLTIIKQIAGKEERRSYSISSSTYLNEPLSVTVKKVEGGLVSDLLVNHLSKGEEVDLLPPMGHFTFEPDPRRVRHIVLIGAGSGITPLFSILKTVLYAEPESYVSLIYGNRSFHSIIFKAELDGLMEQFGGRMKLVHCLSQPPDVWYGASGRINPDLLNEIFDSIEPARRVEDTLYYLCGPAGMMQTAEEVLKRNGIAEKKIHKESFFNAELNEAKEQHMAEQKDAQVTIKMDGKTYHITVPNGSTVLEAALDENIRMPYSCQSGLCTACMGKCLEGELMLDAPDGLSDEEIAAGYVLTCVGRPKTAKVVIEIL